eukprot:6490921-Amphidinium_carterae.1
MNKPKSFAGEQSDWGEWSFVFRAYVAAIDPRLRDVVERSAASTHPLALPADGSSDRQLGAQLYYLLALMTTDKALAVVRNVEEGHGMESWRRLSSTYEPRTGMRFGALLQVLLRYQIGAGDDTDLAHEIDKFEHDVRKYEDQSGEKLSNTIRHSILCSGMQNKRLREHIDLNMDRLRTYEELKDEIITYSRARRLFYDPDAMQVDVVGKGKDGKGKGKADKEHKGKAKGKGKEGKEKPSDPKAGAACHYCGKKGHYKRECRKLAKDSAIGNNKKGGASSGAGAASSSSTGNAPAAAITQEQSHGDVWFLSPLLPEPTAWLPSLTEDAGNMIAQLSGLDGSEFALLDSGSGVTACPEHYASDHPLLEAATLPTLKGATGATVTNYGRRRVGYRLETGAPLVIEWNVTNVTVLIVAADSLVSNNMKVQLAKGNHILMLPNGEKVPVHRYAKVYWIKLQRSKDISVEGLTVAATSVEAKAEAIAMAPDEVQQVDDKDKDDKDDNDDNHPEAEAPTGAGEAASSWDQIP